MTRLILIVSFLLAALSVLFEFTIAQFLTVFHGSTSTVYFLTVGFYSFFLGLGAFFYDYKKNKTNRFKLFIRSELMLVLTVMLSPFFILITGNTDLFLLKLLLGFLPLIMMSFFSGLELPFLLHLVKQKTEKDSVMFWDFFGMCLGGIAFSFFFLEYFSLFKVIYLGTAINCSLMFFISNKFLFKDKIYSNIFVVLGSLSIVLFLLDTRLINLFRILNGY